MNKNLSDCLVTVFATGNSLLELTCQTLESQVALVELQITLKIPTKEFIDLFSK